MAESPRAVLLDVGGVFHLPLRHKIAAALQRADLAVPDEKTMDRAHYRAVGVFPFDTAAPEEPPAFEQYLPAYARSLGVNEADLPVALHHLGPEFASVALWGEIVEGSRSGLEELAGTGVMVGVVSNSDGSVAERLRSQGILQVGEGPGVEVRCVVDSGDVGVAKPDPRIFAIALNAVGVEPEEAWYVGDTPGIDVVGATRAGIRPLLMDPYHLYRALGIDAVGSLHEVAVLVGA